MIGTIGDTSVSDGRTGAFITTPIRQMKNSN